MFLSHVKIQVDKNCNATTPTTNNKQSAPAGKLGMSVSLDQKPKQVQAQQNAQNNSLQINDNVAFPNEQPALQMQSTQATNSFYSQNVQQQQQLQQPNQQSQRQQPTTQDQQHPDTQQSEQQEESSRHQFVHKNISNINNKVNVCFVLFISFSVVKLQQIFYLFDIYVIF